MAYKVMDVTLLYNGMTCEVVKFAVTVDDRPVAAIDMMRRTWAAHGLKGRAGGVGSRPALPLDGNTYRPSLGPP